jgi:hypothetical protein
VTVRKPLAKVIREALRDDAAIVHLDECLSAVADGEPGQSFADTPLGTYLHGGLVQPACHQDKDGSRRRHSSGREQDGGRCRFREG